MSEAFDAKVHVEQMETLMGLEIEEAWRPVVIQHMTAIQAAAETVMAFPLEDDIEAAPVFTA
ncbi:DUF4089 domain-containing protein [Roseibium denhamense]|uniref:DUF4089 domain-containing protein n=1 Tax=Roseibium denhamense TaxID=76305 RepID=A0ABY1PII9_9HYPH|nr:DUF4089 domain-containing protein [Roseibium denhamense]MTI05539.1 DUF4089 domain-containing protein [Roseibium denhamense]SMP35138.1 Protein of unknown function [Roseibium denhamense]